MPTDADAKPKLLAWTRAGIVEGAWGAYESFESLVFSAPVAAQLQKLALGFMSSQDVCRQARLPWRRGAFVFGAPGTGKSAASRAVSLMLGWQHMSIPAYEIIDTHHLTRALFDVPRLAPAVVVLENVDELFKRIDTAAFFDIFDAVAEKTDGVFWVATSRRPEDVPKSQLVRPGRFEESLRLSPPTAEVKKKYFETYLEPFLKGADVTVRQEQLQLLDSNDQLTFAHLHEMRLLLAKVLMEGDPERLIPEFQTFVREQVFAGDRWGGVATTTAQIDERVRHADPRLLASALEVTDAFKRVVEMTVTSASEALLAAQAEAKK